MIREKLTIGQLAKCANVSVRTLQHYDQIGLMRPSEISENGRRIYQAKDIAKLQQILYLKSLGFSLEDIKDKIIPVNGSDDVVHLLSQQAEVICNKIERLQKVVESIKMLKTEINMKKEVDWNKYSSMVRLIQENCGYYWVVNYLDKKVIGHLLEQQRRDKEILPGWWREIFESAIALEASGVRPESMDGQRLAEQWWKQMQKLSDGKLEIINKMVDFYYSAEQWPEEFKTMQQKAQLFMERAFLHYMEENNIKLPERDA